MQPFKGCLQLASVIPQLINVLVTSALVANLTPLLKEKMSSKRYSALWDKAQKPLKIFIMKTVEKYNLYTIFQAIKMRREWNLHVNSLIDIKQAIVNRFYI